MHSHFLAYLKPRPLEQNTVSGAEDHRLPQNCGCQFSPTLGAVGTSVAKA